MERGPKGRRTSERVVHDGWRRTGNLAEETGRFRRYCMPQTKNSSDLVLEGTAEVVLATRCGGVVVGWGCKCGGRKWVGMMAASRSAQADSPETAEGSAKRMQCESHRVETSGNRGHEGARPMADRGSFIPGLSLPVPPRCGVVERQANPRLWCDDLTFSQQGPGRSPGVGVPDLIFSRSEMASRAAGVSLPRAVKRSWKPGYSVHVMYRASYIGSMGCCFTECNPCMAVPALVLTGHGSRGESQ